MNKILSLAALLLVSALALGQTKGWVDRQTKEFHLVANMKKDHRIFGYRDPNTHSPKMIFFSIFTADVDGNPNNCPLGSYYDTSGLKEGDSIVFVNFTGDFAKMNYITAKGKKTIFYFQRNSFRFS